MTGRMTGGHRKIAARPWRTLLWICFAGLLGLALFSCASMKQPYTGPVSQHFDGERFHINHQNVKSFSDVLKWQLNREQGGPWVRDLTPTRTPALPQRVASDELRVTFVNHATVLIQIAGINLLTDPIWSERASPLSWAGPERFRPPGVEFSALPPIDVVLISHNHYDHMDLATLTALRREHDPLFVVPLGNCHYLEMGDNARCQELDWWQNFEFEPGFLINAVPVQHWSRRGLFDTNQALWAGYMVVASGHSLFFAGDTGWGEHFAEVRQRLGPPDLAILPIGAYLPRWFMSVQHISPEEAVSAHRELEARRSMAIHFGTFRLADEGQEQPVGDLRDSLAAAGLPEDTFWVPENGEQRDAAQLGLQTEMAETDIRPPGAAMLTEAAQAQRPDP
jgi:L-ascorbate metabolism protein UlaG (beta-lactamase superfamily)